MEFRNGGAINFLVLFLGALGVVPTLAAIVLTIARSPACRWAGIAAAVIATLTAGAGALGVVHGRSVTRSALEGDDIRPTMRERILREGYLESRSCAKFGLGFAVWPMLTAFVGVFAGRRRPQAPAPPDAAFAPFGPPPPPPPSPSAGGVGLAVALPFVGLGVAAVFADVALLLQAVPGRDMTPSEAQFLDAKEGIEAGDTKGACHSLESVLTDSALGADERSVALSLAGQCADSRLDELLKEAPDDRRRDLAEFASSPLLDDAHKARVSEELSKVTLPKPTVRIDAVDVNGRLPPEVIRRIVRQHFGQVKSCYEKGLASSPTLTGRVVVSFVIGRDGNVSTASERDSDLPDPSVRQCIVRVFQGLSFPAPEGGIVTVKYPLDFKSSN